MVGTPLPPSPVPSPSIGTPNIALDPIYNAADCRVASRRPIDSWVDRAIISELVNRF
jgi:hypothetical protein